MVAHLVEREALVAEVRRQRVERGGQLRQHPVFFDGDEGHGSVLSPRWFRGTRRCTPVAVRRASGAKDSASRVRPMPSSHASLLMGMPCCVGQMLCGLRSPGVRA